jgi:bleomycin hydrolase
MRRIREIAAAAILACSAAACEQPVATPEPLEVEQKPEPPPEEPAEAEKRIVEIRLAAEPEEDEAVTVARYETRTLDPVLEELRRLEKERKAEAGERTAEIVEKHEKDAEKERKEKLVLRSSLPEAERPTSPDQFEQIPHIPPVPQFYTGTCWSFAMTSFMESEGERKTGELVDLSEMSTVYFEYLRKARGFVAERGESLFAEGSETNALTHVWSQHGAWPAEAYPGVVGEDARHDHQRLAGEMKAVLESVEERSLWDEATVLGMLRVILDREMGRPPESFEYEGETYEPERFMDEVLSIRPGEYVEMMSTLEVPFWTRGELDVPDNWWHDDSYHNVPLEDFYAGLENAITSGYGVTIAVDVSEPGKDAANDTLFVPSYDIPSGRIDQIAREYRFAHGVTTDDHGVHVVGFTEHAGHDWFLVKDSGRSSRHGNHEGYYFMRDDYVRLKVLAYSVHRDAVEDLLAKFPPAPEKTSADP